MVRFNKDHFWYCNQFPKCHAVNHLFSPPILVRSQSVSFVLVQQCLAQSAPGQRRDEQVGTYREVEQKVGIARGLANKLRARHLEAYDQQGGPVAYADTFNTCQQGQNISFHKIRKTTQEPGRLHQNPSRRREEASKTLRRT